MILTQLDGFSEADNSESDRNKGFFISGPPLLLESLYKQCNELFLKIMSADIGMRIIGNEEELERKAISLENSVANTDSSVLSSEECVLDSWTGRNSLALDFSITPKFQPKYVREIDFTESSRNRM